jgi:two-component system phosphate regulon sensor histidine kinase PhoR
MMGVAENQLMRSEIRRWTIASLGVIALGLAIHGAWSYGGGFNPSRSLLIGGLLLLGVVFVSILGRVAQEAAKRGENLEAALHAAADEIQRHRDALDQFAGGLDVSILVTDPKLQVLYANQLAGQVFGQDQRSDRSLMTLTLSHDLEDLVRKAVNSAQPQKADITLHHPVHRVFQVRAWMEPPAMDRVFITMYDLTQIRRLERMRRDFVGNVSHELRTPMATVRVMAETLKDEPDTDEETRVRYLDTIIQEVDRLASVTRDLLTLSQVESQPVARELGDLAALVRRAADFAEIRAEDKGLELRCSAPEVLMISMNQRLMEQVAANLLANAIAYTPSGSISISLVRDEDLAVLEVRDTGMGIATEHQGRVFERFYRVDKGRSRATGGTGLGLAIVKNIVEAHGGKISLESHLNQGSTFRVELPIETL